LNRACGAALVPLVKYKTIYKRLPRRTKFLFEVNAATKRPPQNNKHGTSAEQAGRGAHVDYPNQKRPAR
jgi:hypothetical protein